jgi:isopentenyl diphosphate isomerase/L-lactate dehydrogenase-like FMN-dependent dehydrogenase
MPFLNLREVEALARARLPAATYDYFAGGANDEVTLAENCRAFETIALRYRVLVDVSRRSPAATLLGAPTAAPIVVAPMAFQRLAHPEGELAMARAAGSLGLPFTASTFATCSLEEIAAATTGPLWFQLYVHQDRGITRALVERAAAAGYRALVLTVDVPEIGRRERDERNGFRLSADLRVANFIPKTSAPLQGEAPGSALATFIHDMRDPSLSWKDLEWLGSFSKMPLILKGLVRVDDARRALDCGAAGIVVSNHGGRQLDTAIAGLRALPAIAEAVGDRLLVMMDGGVRRGTDVLKALALGARAVMVGRPVLWGLAVDGEAGARRVLELLRDELDLAMALSGAPTLADITPDLLA